AAGGRPGRRGLEAGVRAARRGVDVQVRVPEDSNHSVADWASRGFFGKMLEAVITILLYSASIIHAKTATVGGIWSTVG
ncbi:phosphatidylserine/phosphatidylglycerophosphate/cardiolipin synthase family protein, partial [Micrococcus sp. SIMBA_131]